MSRDCPGCRHTTIQLFSPYRTVAFFDTLNESDDLTILSRGIRGMPIHYVLSPDSVAVRKIGKSFVSCACDEPGHHHIGMGVTLLWASDADALRSYVETIKLQPVVLLALLDGPIKEYGSADSITTEMRDAGSTVVVVDFESRSVVHVLDGAVTFLRGAPI